MTVEPHPRIHTKLETKNDIQTKSDWCTIIVHNTRHMGCDPCDPTHVSCVVHKLIQNIHIPKIEIH
jgi:hypothetical protein